MEKIFTSGNRGEGVRSDCYVEVVPGKDPLKVQLKSKVSSLYGQHIQKLAFHVAEALGMVRGLIRIDDQGALDFVLAARLEAAIQQENNNDKEFLLPIREENLQESPKRHPRITRLYLPGNTPKLMINAGVHSPAGIILDLEDSVAPAKKYEARFLVRNALRSLSFYGAERMVRINQMPAGLKDLPHVIPHGVNMILVPKCESAQQIQLVNEQVELLKQKHDIRRNIWLMPIIESAVGVIHAWEIASAAENVVAMAIGLEDYTADLGTSRSQDGKESFMARSQMVNACRAAGIQPIDSVFSHVDDQEALRWNVIESKQLGFEGMGCIHPRQIAVIHKAFAPEPEELEKALVIRNAYIKARAQGQGVIAVGSKMIDPPVIKKAEQQIQLAINAGILDPKTLNENTNN